MSEFILDEMSPITAKEAIKTILKAANKARKESYVLVPDTFIDRASIKLSWIDADIFIQALREEIENESLCSGYCHKAKQGETFTCSCLCCK